MDILSFQATPPEPLKVETKTATERGITMTAATYFWDAGQTRHCRRCSRCTADHARAICTLLLPGRFTSLAALQEIRPSVITPQSSDDHPSFSGPAEASGAR